MTAKAPLTRSEVGMATDMPTTVGRGAGLEALKGLFSQMTATEFILTSEEMELMGDYAYDHGTSTTTMMPTAKGAKLMTKATRYLAILHRDSDGSWRVARDIDNVMPKSRPPRSRPLRLTDPASR